MATKKKAVAKNVTSKMGQAKHAESNVKKAAYLAGKTVGKAYETTDAAYRRDRAEEIKSKDARMKLARDEEKFSSSMRKR